MEKVINSYSVQQLCSSNLSLMLLFQRSVVLHTFMKHGKNSTKQLYYAAAGVSYLFASVCSTVALRHVNYPTQVVGKSCKPIPVMILGVLIGKMKYPSSKYVYVLMIVVGVCLFMYKDKPAVADSEDSSVIGMGEILLLVSLVLDGFLGSIQDRMKSVYQTKPAHMMYYINIWTILILGPVVVFTSEIWTFLQFVEKYPYVMYNVLGLSIMNALGQVFIYLVVSEFGALWCSIITTTRKFFTLLGSVFLFGNTLTPRQWFGTALVFTGLFLDSVYGKREVDKKTISEIPFIRMQISRYPASLSSVNLDSSAKSTEVLSCPR